MIEIKFKKIYVATSGPKVSALMWQNHMVLYDIYQVHTELTSNFIGKSFKS